MPRMLILSIVNTPCPRPCVVSTLMRTRISSENTNDAPRHRAGSVLRVSVSQNTHNIEAAAGGPALRRGLNRLRGIRYTEEKIAGKNDELNERQSGLVML